MMTGGCRRAETMTPALAAEIADEQVRHWRYAARITARQAWQSMDLPPQGYVSWPMVRREVLLLVELYDASLRPARRAA